MSYEDDVQSPYDPQSPNLEGETPELEEAIRYAIRSEMLRMRVSLPAKITSVKDSKGTYTPQLVSVQPMLKVRNTDNTLDNLPIIQDVPVVMPMGRNYGLRLPSAVGDLGTLLFCDRALNAFVDSDGQTPVDPQDTRLHDFTDPQFFPGLLPRAAMLDDTSDDVVLYNQAMQLRLTKDGKLALKNQTAELLAQLSQLADALASLAGDLGSAKAMVLVPPATVPAAWPLDPVTTNSASQLQATAQQIKSAIDSLKT